VTFLPIRIDAPPEIPIVTMVARSTEAHTANATAIVVAAG
jgi:hypothetical protein